MKEIPSSAISLFDSKIIPANINIVRGIAMLSLLLDENISPMVAAGVTKKRPEIAIMSLFHWQEGKLLGHGDELILIAAHEANLTLA